MLYAASAYILWGLFPLYFKALQGVPPLEILFHRIVWALVFLLVVLTSRQQWAWVGKLWRQPKVLAGFAASALLLSANWFIYIWSVNSGHVVDASLGYFITPRQEAVLLDGGWSQCQWAPNVIPSQFSRSEKLTEFNTTIIARQFPAATLAITVAP